MSGVAPEVFQALVVRPGLPPAVEEVDEDKLGSILGRRFFAHPAPLWRSLRVVCLVREATFPLEPPNTALPVTFAKSDCPHVSSALMIEPVFGTIVFVSYDASTGEPMDLTVGALIKLRALLSRLPHSRDYVEDFLVRKLALDLQAAGGDPCRN